MVGRVNLAGDPRLDSNTLRNDAPNQWRWLSIPNSRVVLNPGSSCSRNAPAMGADLPLNAGYWSFSRDGSDSAAAIPWSLATVRLQTGAPQQAPALFEVKAGGADGFFSPKERWRAQSVRMATEQGAGRLTADGPYGAAVLDLGDVPRGRRVAVTLEVLKAEGAWSLKVNAGQGADALVLQGDNHQAGAFTYEFEPDRLERSGGALSLKLYAIGAGKSVWLKSLEVTAVEDGTLAAAPVRTAWYPHRIAFEAEYPDAGVQITGQDYFQSENAVVRLLRVRGAALSGKQVVLRGRGEERSGTLLVDAGRCFYALAFARLRGETLAPSPLKKQARPAGPGWELRVPLTAPTDLALAVGFASKQEGAEQAVRRALACLRGKSLTAALAARKEAWDALLRRVPAPARFGIEAVDALGVTPEQHRLFYYGAWAFVLSNLLPPMPESDYPYAQTPCGKPSGWAWGTPRARPSCAWESFFGQQLLAYVLPDAAWSAFEGILSDVDAQGQIAGECLPSRKAQTAWILFSLSGDRSRLARVYPAIKRYLLWREQNPRWIFGEHNNPQEKDGEFVISLLVDVEYAARIAQVLGDEEDQALWRDVHARVLQRYREWYFFTDGRPPAQYYFLDSKTHHAGRDEVIVTGLHLRDLPADLAEQLKRYALRVLDPKKSLAGFGASKYPDSSFVAYGLLEQGMRAQAIQFINAVLRDTIRAGEFCEVVHPNGGFSGTRPTLFSASQVIDFTWLQNGMRLDQGRPTPIPDGTP